MLGRKRFRLPESISRQPEKPLGQFSCPRQRIGFVQPLGRADIEPQAVVELAANAPIGHRIAQQRREFGTAVWRNAGKQLGRVNADAAKCAALRVRRGGIGVQQAAIVERKIARRMVRRVGHQPQMRQ